MDDQIAPERDPSVNQSVMIALNMEPTEVEEMASTKSKNPPNTLQGAAQTSLSQKSNAAERNLEIFQKLEAVKQRGLLRAETVHYLKANEAILSDPKLTKIFNKYHPDGNGELDDEEIAHMLNDLIQKKQQLKLMGIVAGFAALFVIILLLSNTLLTLWMLNITQVVHTDDSNKYLTNRNGDLVVTDKPLYYVTIADIPSLPTKALNALTRLSFATIDASVHNYDVQGIKFGSATDPLHIYFTSSKELVFHGEKAVLYDVLPDGTRNALDLATSSKATLQRRLQLMQDVDSSDSSFLSQRCSEDSGVCFYTFDEMMAINNGHLSGEVEEEVDSFGNRRLSGSSPSSNVGFAEISADAIALRTDTRSALSEASGLLSGILDHLNISKSNTTVISFHMLDRCINYPELFQTCLSPAPADQEAVNNNNGDDPFVVPPFLGLVVRNGRWYFDDEIVYSKDINTIQIKVRYAHDNKKLNRMHVVMVDRNKPTHIVSYDEITTVVDPADDHHLFTTPQTYITNYTTKSIDDSGVSIGRRLQAAEDFFHAHVTDLIAGFPVVTIPELDEMQSIHNDFDGLTTFSRKLDSGGSATEIRLEAALVNSTCSLLAINATEKEYHKTAADYIPFCGNSTYGVDTKALFYGLQVTTAHGLIAWPNKSQEVMIQTFLNVPIVKREELQEYVNQNSRPTVPVNSVRMYADDIEYYVHSKDEDSYGSVDQKELGAFRLWDKMKLKELKEHLHKYNMAHEALMAPAAMHSLVSADEVCSPTPSPVQAPTSYPTYEDPLYKPFVTAAVLAEQIQCWNSRLVCRSTTYVAQKYASGLTSGTIISSAAGSAATIPTLLYLTNSLDSPCATFNSAWGSFLANIAIYVPALYTMQNGLNKIISGTDTIATALDKLNNIVTVRNVMRPVASALGNAPYVGAVITQVFRLFSASVEVPVVPIRDQVNSLQTKLQAYKIKCKAISLLNIVNKLLAALTYVSKANREAQGLVIIDNFCPGFSSTVSLCSSIGTPLQTVNSVMDSIRSQIQSIASTLDSFANVVNILQSFVRSLDFGVLNTINGALNQLTDYLSQDISSCVNVPYPCLQSQCTSVSYPCGTNTCQSCGWCCCWSYPCGIQYCSKQVCADLPAICYSNLCYRFSAMSIINGAMSVVQAVQDGFVAIVSGAIKAMGLNIPTINLPSLPDLSEITNLVGNLGQINLDNPFSDLLPKLNALIPFVYQISNLPNLPCAATISNKYIRIRLTSSNTCLDLNVPYNSHHWSCSSGNGNQLLKIVPLQGKSFMLQQVGSSLCLDSGGQNQGSSFHSWACITNVANQQFTYDGTLLRLYQNSNMCYDDNNGYDGHVWSCDSNNPNQRLNIECCTGSSCSAMTSGQTCGFQGTLP